MDKILPQLRADYEYWANQIDSDPYEGQKTVGIIDVLHAHYLIVDHFARKGEGIGGTGPRDLNLLHSTLGRQLSSFSTTTKWNDELEICATLFFGLIKNHPFHDGNKRTALLTALYHLGKLKRVPQVQQRELEQLAVRVATNQLSNYKDFSKVRKQDDPEVRFIARFFRRATRKTDFRYYPITYRQLNTILSRFGYELVDPNDNYINVVRWEEETYWEFLRKKKRTVRRRVAVISFPGWTREISDRELHRVRKVTILTPENHVDSGVFFMGEEPLEALITYYEGPLSRLADK
jgi:death-on-curing family protein